MPHIKTFGRYREVAGQGTQLAWLLLASHNLSKAAWGTLQKNGDMPLLILSRLGQWKHMHCHVTWLLPIKTSQ